MLKIWVFQIRVAISQTIRQLSQDMELQNLKSNIGFIISNISNQ